MALKTLSTLIKIHKQKTDVLRREMMALYEEQHQLEVLTDRLHGEHEKENQLVVHDPTLASFFGAYSRSVKKRLADIGEEIKRLSGAIETKRDEISEEFSEQKKYEIARDNIKKDLMAKEKARQQERFDEVGSQQFMRSQDTPI